MRMSKWRTPWKYGQRSRDMQLSIRQESDRFQSVLYPEFDGHLFEEFLSQLKNIMMLKVAKGFLNRQAYLKRKERNLGFGLRQASGGLISAVRYRLWQAN